MNDKSDFLSQSDAHTHFASSANNRGWDLAETAALSADEAAELLNCAHAAAFHWNAVGTPLHQARALLLLGLAHARLGLGATGVRFSSQAVETISQSSPEDWEQALCQSVLAIAHHGAGNVDAYEQAVSKADAAIAAIPQGPNRDIVQGTHRLIPRH